MFKFLTARHRSIYTSIAFKYFVWPEKVYNLAHGKHAKSRKDKKIIHELLAQGVIHRHSDNFTSEDKVVFDKDK